MKEGHSRSHDVGEGHSTSRDMGRVQFVITDLAECCRVACVMTLLLWKQTQC